MKRLLPLFLFLLCAFQANAGMNPYVAGAVPAAAQTCQIYEDRSAGQDSYWILADNANNTFLGQSSYVMYPNVDATLCAVTIMVVDRSGTINGISYQIEVHTLSGDNFVSASAPGSGCTSTARTDISQTYPASYKFEGLSCAMTSGTPYAVVMTRTDHSYDGSNNAYIGLKASATTNYAGNAGRYNASGTYDVLNASWEFSFIYWTMQ